MSPFVLGLRDMDKTKLMVVGGKGALSKPTKTQTPKACEAPQLVSPSGEKDRMRGDPEYADKRALTNRRGSEP